MGKRLIRRLAVAGLLFVTATAALAADCISKTQLVATRGIMPNRVAGPVAWNGSALAVAKQETGFARAIHVSLYDQNLDSVTADVRAAEASLRGPAALLWTGHEFGLFYQGTDARIRLQLISATGQLIGSSVVITPNHPVFNEDEFHVIWDPTRSAYVMARSITQTSERGVWLEVLERDGRTRADRHIELFAARPANPRVAVTQNGTIGVFYIHDITRALTLIRVSPTDALDPSVPVSSSPGLSFDVHARNNVFGVVRRVPVAPNRTEIRWVALDHTGAFVTGDHELVASRGRDVAIVSLRGNGEEWALAYIDSPLGFDIDPGEFRLHRFTTSGSVISNTLFSSDRARYAALGSDPFIWTGAAYVTSAEFFVSATEGSDSYLLSHCPIKARAAATKVVIRQYDTITFSADVQGGSGPFRYNWEFGDRNFATGSPVTHRYLHLGTYTVTVTVTDAAGGTSISSLTVRVVEGKRRAVRR